MPPATRASLFLNANPQLTLWATICRRLRRLECRNSREGRVFPHSEAAEPRGQTKLTHYRPFAVLAFHLQLVHGNLHELLDRDPPLSPLEMAINLPAGEGDATDSCRNHSSWQTVFTKDLAK